MFLVALDKFFTQPLAISTAVESTDTTAIPGQQYKLFGQLIDSTTGTVQQMEYLANANTLTTPIRANQVYVASTGGYDLTTEILQSFGPLQGTIKKLYVINMAPKATYTNVRIYPYSATGRFKVEVSTNGSVWTDQRLTIPVWQPREIKEIYIRVRLVNTSKPVDTIGLGFGYDSVTGRTDFSQLGNYADVFWRLPGRLFGYILNDPWRIVHYASSYAFITYCLNITNGSTSKIFDGAAWGVDYSHNQPHMAVSKDGSYFFLVNRLYRTDNWATVFTVSDADIGVPSCAAITPDNRFLVYMSTQGLKVVRIPSGELERLYPLINMSVFNHVVGVWAKSPTEIWFYAGLNVAKLNPEAQTIPALNRRWIDFVYAYYLDERYLLFVALPSLSYAIFDTYAEKEVSNASLPVSLSNTFVPYTRGALLFCVDGTLQSSAGQLVTLPAKIYSDGFAVGYHTVSHDAWYYF